VCVYIHIYTYTHTYIYVHIDIHTYLPLLVTNIVFKHPVALMYLKLYTYIFVLNATYYLVTFLPHYIQCNNVSKIDNT
jgi:hypothetical protein